MGIVISLIFIAEILVNSEEHTPVFTLSNLAQLHKDKLVQHKVISSSVHALRLKHQILAHFSSQCLNNGIHKLQVKKTPAPFSTALCRVTIATT